LDAQLAATKNNSATSSTSIGSNPGTDMIPMSSLELGAGLGLPSIVMARHRVQEVIATDYDPAVLELLEKNLQNNLDQALFDSSSSASRLTTVTATAATPRVTTKPLDWAYPKEEFVEKLAPDVIIASDVIWNATRPIWKDFLSLLCRLRYNYLQKKNRFTQDQQQHNVARSLLLGTDTRFWLSQDPIVLMGYTQRRRDMSIEEERLFFELVRSHGMQVRKLPDVSYNEHWPLTVFLELYWEDEGMKHERVFSG